MSKYVINDTTLTAIGDAVREKGGTSELIPVSGLADAIINLPSGGGGDVEPIVLSGNQQYACASDIATSFIQTFPTLVSTKDLTVASYMFAYSKLKKIPFDINWKKMNLSYDYNYVNYMFYSSGLEELPKFVGAYCPGDFNSTFAYCEKLKEIPEELFEECDFSLMSADTSAYGKGSHSDLFVSCYKLRSHPKSLFKQGNINRYTANPIYNSGFNYCYNMREIYLPVYDLASMTYNRMNTFRYSLCNLRKLVFNMNDDGTPINCGSNWKSQTIDLSNVGYGTYHYQTAAGLSFDDQVENDEQYAAKKDRPDWWSSSRIYSHYNHDSAVETINSLPDVSGGSGNVIKFAANNGANTDGGAIKNLTEEEIAVATARGWTVTLV